VPIAATRTILGSLGGALGVAHTVGGATGAVLSHAARAAFMSGLEMAFIVGGCVAIGGAVVVLAWLPSRHAAHFGDPIPPVLGINPRNDRHESQVDIDG
jgi:hypothetical protein